MFGRPPRALCLALRASDQRINLATATIVPESAAYPGCRAWYREHTVFVDKRLLAKVCRAVEAVGPGELVEEVAGRLGVHPHSMDSVRKNGTLNVVHKKGLCGRKGKPVPVITSAPLLDPTAWGKRGPDPIWGGWWRVAGESMPDGFADRLIRAPETRLVNGRKHHMGWRWICRGCGRRVKTVYLPTRASDWGEYVRDRGAISDAEARMVGLRGARELLRMALHGSKEEAAAVLRDGAAGRPNEVDAVGEPPACFACGRCHRVAGWTRAKLGDSWNHLVLHFSGGLLYGREVRRPAWLTASRVRAYVPHRRAAARGAPRREELTRLLVRTEMSLGEIAVEMGIKAESVRLIAGKIYRRHGVTGREGLRAAVGEAGRAVA